MNPGFIIILNVNNIFVGQKGNYNNVSNISDVLFMKRLTRCTDLH